jgi:preprotein translocase subunit SecG
MSPITIVFLVIHLIVAISLILVVLLQSGKSAGLSGAISGGAETFFGKNKGRTIDNMLKKWTTVVAVIFIITAIILSISLTK